MYLPPSPVQAYCPKQLCQDEDDQVPTQLGKLNASPAMKSDVRKITGMGNSFFTKMYRINLNLVYYICKFKI